jgi:protein-S-isoprenylcysteine O-methyltransferase Ste14
MRRSNVPVPEPHVAALLGAATVHWLLPLRLPIDRAMARGIGLPMLAGGAGLGAWAVASAGEVSVEHETGLVTSGAYAVSRNPMYVGWSAAVLGLALAARSAWLLAGLALAVRALDGEIRTEESRLLERFGSDYEAYRGRVPRYLNPPSIAS